MALSKDINAFLGQNVQIIKHHLSGLIAFYKPEGIKSHPNKSGDVDKKSILLLPYDSKLEAYLDECGNPVVYLLHRLDSPTSGVLLGAVNKDIADHVKLLFKQKQIKKIYYALVKGPVNVRSPLWVDKMERQKMDQKLRVRAGEGDIAKTKVTLVKQGRMALLRLEPITGKSHQLRVQCANRGYPIVGDKTYGQFQFNRDIAKKHPELNRLMLHAGSIEVPMKQGSAFVAESPYGDHFNEFLT